MSYEKVKCITRKPKENRITITSACNNVRPITYHTWEFMSGEEDYHTKELEIMRGINGGGLSLNNSCYNWNYAYYKTNEHFRAIDEKYDLYSLSSLHYDTYVIGETYSSTYISITESDLTSDFVLDYESKDGKTKTYYKKSQKDKEEVRARAILEEYHKVFIQFLDEKKIGKYYLYSPTYGYVKPKGTTGSFYYSQYESMIELMEYKKAYCLAKNMGRDVEVRAEVKRTHEPSIEQINEGKARLNDIIGLDTRFSDKLYLSDTYTIREIKPTEFDLIGAINDFEETYNGHVYHVVYIRSNFGDLFNMFYVSNNNEEWNDDRELLKNGETYAYVYNKTDKVCSEIGLIGFSKEENGNLIKRTF